MIRISAYLLCGVFFAALLSGCNVTFQSSQFNFVKGLFALESPPQEKNWEVRWQGKIYPVFAVNHGRGTLFADENGFLVSFDGWQIRQVLIPQLKNEKIAVIQKSATDDGAISLDYRDGNARQLARDKCQAWERTTVTGWEQNCKNAEHADSLNLGYTNAIELNTNGELVALRFMVLPGRDSMQIRLKQQRPLAGSD